MTPIHRYYVYFYERILGKLIGDPTFALPFWNWDSPPGMKLPALFTNPSSPIYEELRNANHQPPTLPGTLLTCRPPRLNRSQLSRSRCSSLDKFIALALIKNLEPTQSRLLLTSRSTSGLVMTPKNYKDMENLYSAARDPIFFSHHCNVDRMWSVWKTLSRNNKDIIDPNWLDSGFLFYDENAQLVRVKVRDCLDTKKLGYVYQDVDIPWLASMPTTCRSKLAKAAKATIYGGACSDVWTKWVGSGKFPIKLDSKISMVITRPKRMKRSKKDKEDEEEILVIGGIEFERHGSEFDAYVNDLEDNDRPVKPDDSKFAWSFMKVPHKHKEKNKKATSCLRLGLTDLLEDLEAEDDSSLVVTLVPRYGTNSLMIACVKIEFLADD